MKLGVPQYDSLMTSDSFNRPKTGYACGIVDVQL